MGRCSLCKLTQKHMNNLPLVYQKRDQHTPSHASLSPLHDRIKFMENVLKISYRLGLPTPTWGEELSAEAIKKVTVTMSDVQRKFRDQLGLHVDEVRQNFGNSNDGNTSRRFFKEPAVTAEITKVDQGLLHRFKTILDTINSKENIDAVKFDN